MSKNILIIDSDKNFSQALSERLKACEFTSAGIISGAQFFQIATKFMPDTLILSTNLIHPSWTELIERIKQSQTISKIDKIILLTNEITIAITHQAKIHKIHKILQKPIKFKELYQILQQ